MIGLPQSPFLDSAGTIPADEAATSSPPASQVDVAADQSSTTNGGMQEAPAADAANPHETAGAFDCIAEIFVGAMKLDHQFVLDEARFMADIEEIPLFLQRASA